MRLLRRPSIALVATVSALGLAVVHCGFATSDVATGAFESDAGASTSYPAPQPGAEAGAGPRADESGLAPNAGQALDANLLLVNATTSFSAFRVCPAVGSMSVSESRTPPQPTTLMPQSSLAGVDVNGATQLAPQADFKDADNVLVLRVDDETKAYPALAIGTCKSLACSNGSGCIGATKLFKVPIEKGAFASTGKIIALRGSPPNLRFEVIPIVNQKPSDSSALRVDFRNLSQYNGAVAFRRGETGALVALTDGNASELSVGTDYAEARFEAGAASSSFIDIHQASDPRTPIETFFSSPGTFALVLLGSTGDAGPGQGLRFLMVPVSAPGAGRDAAAE